MSGSLCPQCPQCQVPLDAAHVLWHIKEQKELNLTYEQRLLLPSRSGYLDGALVAEVKKIVSARKPILFMPSEFEEHIFARRGSPIITFSGVLPCGSKAIVGIKNLPIYVDVLDVFAEQVRKHLLILDLKYKEERVKQFKIHGFQTAPSDFVRFHMECLFERKKIIAAITAHNEKCKRDEIIITAADDTGQHGHFLRMAARNYKFMTCGWNQLSNYVALDASKYNAEYRLDVVYTDFCKLKKVERAQWAKSSYIAAVLTKDNTMSASWDIETNTKCPHKSIPTKGDPNYTIFMINSMYSWFHTTTPLLQVSCVDSATEAIKGIVVIECKTPKEVLCAHLHVYKLMHPEMILAFNGSIFDWPLFMDQVTKYSLQKMVKDAMSPQMMSTADQLSTKKSLDEIIKYNLNHREHMKIDAENDHHMDTVTRFHSMVDIDVRPIFMKLYPKAEGNNSSSLNYYLEKNELPSKEDMPYKIMFKVHDRAHLLKTAPTKCHCSSQTSLGCLTQTTCPCCADIQKHIDCVKIGDGEDLIDYSDELLPELTKDGKALCCYCGKRPKNRRDMGLVAYYCAVDCLRPQQLMVKRAIIIERRGLACSSYVPLYDAVYRADGQKVKNLIGSLCFKMGIAFSNAQSFKHESQKEHFPGGYVFPPIRGLNAEWPTTGLDFASLYPSLMMTYNHSPDMVVTCKKYAERLLAEGYSLHPVGPIPYEIGAEKGAADNIKTTISGWSVRHNGIHGPKDTHIITRYERQVTVKCGTLTKTYVSVPVCDEEISPDKRDWLADMAKNNIDCTGFDHTTTGDADLVAIRDGRKALPGERMGLFPIIVKKLFDKRVPIKKIFVQMAEKLKEMETKHEETCEWLVDGEMKTITEAELALMFVMVEVKQKAIKVLANTFYGVSGDYRNSLYSLLVAAGITESGQANIKRVRDFVVKKGFTVRYGDTDSLYIVAPKRIYEGAISRYQTALNSLGEIRSEQLRAKDAYWRELVSLTMKTIFNLTVQVSEFLMWNNGTRFLNMAYEEVGFPTMLCGKKKYFLLPHLKPDNIVFDIKDITTLMVRGIESVKQGQTSMAKRAANLFMCTMMGIAYDDDPLVTAQKIVENSYTAEINYKDFVLSARYKPNKKNVAVHTFVRRMQERAATLRAQGDQRAADVTSPPESNDKFEYVIVQKRQEFDLRGKKIPITKGDKMEHVRVFLASQDTAQPMQIDRNYYIESAYLRIFARFIAYDPRFAHPVVVPTDDEKYKIVDEYSNNLAEKFLVNFVKSLGAYDSDTIKLEGDRNKRLFRAVESATKSTMLANIPYKFGSAVPEAAQLAQSAIDKIHSTPFTSCLAQHLMEKWVSQKANLLELAAAYRPAAYMIKIRHAILLKMQDATMRRLQAVAVDAYNILKRRSDRTTEVMKRLRSVGLDSDPVLKQEDADYISEILPVEIEAMREYHAALSTLRAIEQVKHDLSSIYDLLLKHKRKIAGERIVKSINGKELAKLDSAGFSDKSIDLQFGSAFK